MPLPSFPSRFRRAAALALTASAMFGTQIAALAQDEPPDDGDDTVEIVGWDLSDPVNHAESREFFAGLWAAQDAGLPPPEFEFTNMPPGLILAMLLPELEVFTEIYRHRLQLDFDAGERYLVTDLIADDAEVRAEFRAFVLTGKLAPRPEIDPRRLPRAPRARDRRDDRAAARVDRARRGARHARRERGDERGGSAAGGRGADAVRPILERAQTYKVRPPVASERIAPRMHLRQTACSAQQHG